jgi:decaprenylphospho-beta-D-ribofuranose 2-oxidase
VPVKVPTNVLTGWGHTAPSAAELVQPRTPAEIEALVIGAGRRGLIARGLGRSYGDAAQNAGGTVVDTTGLDDIVDADLASGIVTVGGGLSLDALMRTMVPRGWFVPVTPGTRHVTVGGAIAADIHGKNHHVEGSFASHVLAVTLATPGGLRTVTPSGEPELFWATAGGMGLTGVIVEATVQLLAVETAFVRVDAERCRDLDDVMGRMEDGDHRYRYSVAWVDCVTSGSSFGRAVLTRGDHARFDELAPAARRVAREFSPRVRIEVPPVVPSGLVNRVTMRALNEAWYRRAPKAALGRIQTLSMFFHPLDEIGAWNRMYGPQGFLQYQFVVPFAASHLVGLAIERLADAGIPSSLAVLKRFGPGDPGPLSFPIAGWTLALDMPAGHASLGPVLDGLDEAVASAGGRVYLAKDARLQPALLAAMYPRLAQWRVVQRGVDPDGVLTSDLARRLELV